MKDTCGRELQYLRLSLTPACPMRCMYCRPVATGNTEDIDALTAREIERLVRHLVRHHGLRKVRLTGGEPTGRDDLLEIISRLVHIDGLHDLAMTTNGLTLAASARDYVAAGLMRVNISLDTLDRVRFARMTGVSGLDRVISGIDAAQSADLSPIKLNTVVVRGENDGELPTLVEFAARRGIAIRFIELMPMGPLADQWDARYVSAAEMRMLLAQQVVDRWRPLPQGSDSALCYQATLRGGRSVDIGFITPMSCNFCSACNRLRLTSDGAIYPCLMDRSRGSFLSAVRPVFDARHFDQRLTQALASKPETHPSWGVAVMTTIGG